MPEIKAPKAKPIVRKNKDVDKDSCSCHFLNKMGIPYKGIRCRCGNPLTNKFD